MTRFILYFAYTLFIIAIVHIIGTHMTYQHENFKNEQVEWFECIYKHKELPDPETVCYAIEKLEGRK